MDGQATSMILRFRDLVTEPHGTIALHREVIERHGYVWWGWWSKLGEKVPAEVFQELNRRAKEEGLSVLLFDSGHELLYAATCVEIAWPQDGSRMPSPELDATPAYYRNQPYLAWFKFSEINRDPLESTVLPERTYVRVDSFFLEGLSRYGDFYGKVVSSPEELRQQDRTIWFVRPALSSDPRHEIKILASRKLTPAHFPKDASASSSLTLLWTSDPHFSADNHAFERKATVDRLDLASALERDFKALGVAGLGGLLISGDLTWRASGDEFKWALEFIRQVQSWSRLDDYQIIVCPGNHDIAFSKTPFEKGSHIEAAPAEARAEYEHFYSELYYVPPNEFLSCGRRLLLGGAVSVELASLNSCLLEQAPEVFQGHGFVGDQQLSHAESELGWRGEIDTPRPFRIAMLHHHVVPVAYREPPIAGRTYGVVLDAGALTRWIVRNRVDLVLHGHMHQPFVARLSLPIQTEGQATTWHTSTVVAMGSSGAKREHLGDVGRNTFGLLQFGQDAVSIRVYPIDPVRTREPTDAPVLDVAVSYRNEATERPAGDGGAVL